MNIIFPPRPKGKMLPSDLYLYEDGNWLAQRKFNGSRLVVHISSERKITVGNRHGTTFSKFELSAKEKEDLISCLNLDAEKEYWLDGELMNKKDVNSTKEIIFFDVLQAGKYLFFQPKQFERIEMLKQICDNPVKLNSSGIALEMSSKYSMAETFYDNFKLRYEESLENEQIEGLVLRKKNSGLDSLGDKAYETNNMIRCRKPFSKTKGYEF